MADSVWYYARGDVERGPFTLNQIKALANAAKVRPDDLVWRDGMEAWTPARQIAELFPPAAPIGESNPLPAVEGTAATNPAPPEATKLAGNPRTLGLDRDVLAAMQRGVRLLTVLGVVLLLGARGWESLGERMALRQVALNRLAAAESAEPSGKASEPSDHPLLRHQSQSFVRGVTLFVGLLVLLSGATGLMLLAEQTERWLGVGILVAVIGGLLASMS